MTALPKLIALKDKALSRVESENTARKERDAGFEGSEGYDWIAWLLEESTLEVIKEVWDGKGRKFRVVCPNAEEHTGDVNSGTYFGQSYDGRPYFKCHHAHCIDKFGEHGPELWRNFMATIDAGITFTVGGNHTSSNDHHNHNPYRGDDCDDANEDDNIVWASELSTPDPQQFLVKPLVPKPFPVVFHGSGGSAKSYTLLDFAIRYTNVGGEWLGMPIQSKGRVLYVDFELNKAEWNRRLNKLKKGMELEGKVKGLAYFEVGELPTKRVFNKVRHLCRKHGFNVVIVDSVGPALNGDSGRSTDVLSFHRNYISPLRKDGVTPLLIDHQGRAYSPEEYQTKGAYGNSYKEHMARSIIQLQPEPQAEESDTLTVRFRHKKANFSGLMKPFDVWITFGDDSVKLERQDVPDAELLTERTMSLKARIRTLLKEGPLFADVVAERLDHNRGSVQNTLTRMKKDGEVEENGKEGQRILWGLPSRGVEHQDDCDVSHLVEKGWTPEEIGLRQRVLSGQTVRFDMHKQGPHARFKEWAEDQGYLFYIGRRIHSLGLKESVWHNPFKEGEDGTREEVVRKFKEKRFPELLSREDPEEYRSKALGCYCKLEEACHGDVLIEHHHNHPHYRGNDCDDGRFAYITTPEQLTEALSKLLKSELLGLDLETVGTNPVSGTLRLVQVSDGESTFVVDVLAVDPKPLLECVTTKEIIAHNALFELSWLKHLYGLEPQQVHDTMIMSQVIYAGKIPPHNHGLAEVAKRELGIELDKSQQTSDWAVKELAQQQIEYAAMDAKILPALYKKLRGEEVGQ